MTRACIELDLSRTKPRVNRRGLVLLTLGIAGAALVVLDYRGTWAQRAALELRLDPSPVTQLARKPDKLAERASQDVRVASTELMTPWSRLLQELELASADTGGSVAVLGVEPDREKHQVRVLAEARTLELALAYVKRLQASEALHYPMLESHEVQAKDPQRPVRFQLRADWSAR